MEIYGDYDVDSENVYQNPNVNPYEIAALESARQTRQHVQKSLATWKKTWLSWLTMIG